MTTDDVVSEAVRELFEAALALDVTDRAEYLAYAAPNDGVRRFVQHMLDSDASDAGPLDRSPHAVAQEHYERPSIGGFALGELIGSGGMGLVYRAKQGKPSREVALKVLRGFGVREEASARFRLESELMARLQHDNIARIISAGVDRSSVRQTPYVAMELAEGGDIVAYAQRAGLSPEDRVRMMARIADGVHHAHQRGVIHRDLKPSNILVDKTGVPKIVDFGVARLTDPELSIEAPNTSTGQIIGTLRYMSPEQVDGSGDVDVRTDVYALGVVLCELLTGRMPYDVPSSSLASAAMVIARAPAKNVSRIESRERVALRAVVARSLEKDPRDRYQSAAELRDDLERVLDGSPIRAKRLPLGVRAKRFAKRRRRELVTGSVAAFLVAALLVGVFLFTVVRPRVVGERWADARGGSIDTQAVLGICNVVHWDVAHIAGTYGYKAPPRLVSGDPAYVMAKYDDAVMLAPNERRLRLERDILRYAITFSDRLDPTVEGGSTVPKAAPSIVAYAEQWIEERKPPQLTREHVESLGDEELHALGLFSFVVNDLNTSILALTVYEQRVEPDPMIDAITGLIYIVADRPSSAYPRLRRAHEAFPASGPIRIGLADAAIRSGDLARGERYLQGVDETELLATTRVRVQALLARGRFEEARALHAKHPRTNPFMDEAILADIERRAGVVDAFEFGIRIGAYADKEGGTIVPAGRQFASSMPTTFHFVRRAEAWWAGIGRERRAEMLANESTYRRVERPTKPFRFSHEDAGKRPLITLIAHMFGYNWRNLVMRARLPDVMLPSGDGFEPVRPNDAILAMHARWSDEVASIPDDLADATLAQITAYFTEEVGLLQFSDDLYTSDLTGGDLATDDEGTPINPWTGEPAAFVPFTCYEDRGLWWVGLGLEREDRVKTARKTPDS